MHLPEILAPAGDFDAFKAALENGADAVYLGGKLFNARSSAGNFDLAQLGEVVEIAHLRKVKIYVTVNVLIDNQEITEALLYVKKLYDLNVDGVIVQDLGLADLIRQLLPGMRIHSSTQMTIHNAEGVNFLEEMGIKRVVLAREMSLEDIEKVRQTTKAELEVFAHGALCISYSGQCLMSSLIGGRSGNRGRCAQPCRMAYQLVDRKGQILDTGSWGEHLLSPRDLNTLEILPELCRAGVSSLKFEGRMKRPEYVATVTRIYRGALDRYRQNPDEFGVTEEEKRQLAQIFNRDFSTGYLKGNLGSGLMSYKRPNNRGLRLGRIEKIIDQGKRALIKLDESLQLGDGLEIWVTKGGRQGLFVEEMSLNGKSVTTAEKGQSVVVNILGHPVVGDRIFKTHDAALMGKAQESYKKLGAAVPIRIKIQAREGLPILMEAWDDEEHQARYQSAYLVQKAERHPATEASIIKQLDRLGGTGFKLGGHVLDFEDGLMLPASELNAGRRFLVDQLKEMRLREYRLPPVNEREFQNRMARLVSAFPHVSKKRDQIKRFKLSVKVSGYAAAQKAMEAGADTLYLGGEEFRSKDTINKEQLKEIVKAGDKKGVEIIYVLPRIFLEHEKKAVYRMIKSAEDMGVKGIMTGNPGGIFALRQVGWTGKIYGDFGLNIFNQFTLQTLARMGLARFTLSPELTFEQLARMPEIKGDQECIVHGDLPMMISQYCAIGSLLGGKDCEHKCSAPCRGKYFGLKDRMNYIFPIETDQFCRMHLFNAKELCLIEHLEEFLSGKVSVLRIEAARYQPEQVERTVAAYRQVMDALAGGTIQEMNLKSINDTLERLSTGGFTKGHYFRGVLT